MTKNTKNKAGFSVFYGRMACKEAILKTLNATQELCNELDADVIADKIQEALRKGNNHCINDSMF